MPTIEQKLTGMLVERGMFDDMAAQVMQAVKDDGANESMAQRWNDDTEGYPPQLISALWFSVCYHALEWIDKNLPLAWFRPMFEQNISN